MTNAHVVGYQDEVRIRYHDETDVRAKVVHVDAKNDIAFVMPLEPPSASACFLPRTTECAAGQPVVALGHPLGLSFTLTSGIVSAMERQADGVPMIQTDAAINPGNSGGALVNAAGEVIGINASILSRSGGSEGLGFAIPIDRALRIARDFLEHGEVRRAWLGLDVEPVEADEWGRTRGVRVARIADGSPAAGTGQ